MSGGERYLFSQLGYDLDPLENQIAAHIRAARERGTAFIKKLDDSLGFSGNAQAARLLPEGVAVPLKTLAAAHPSLAAAVERKIQNSKMGETVPELRRLCDGSRLAAGILSLPEEESEALRETLFSSAGADGDEMAELTPNRRMPALDRLLRRSVERRALGGGGIRLPERGGPLHICSGWRNHGRPS